MKMFYIWITIRCYFAFLSIDIFVFFIRYSLRYFSLNYIFHPSNCCYCTKCMAFAERLLRTGTLATQVGKNSIEFGMVQARRLD